MRNMFSQLFCSVCHQLQLVWVFEGHSPCWLGNKAVKRKEEKRDSGGRKRVRMKGNGKTMDKRARTEVP